MALQQLKVHEIVNQAVQGTLNIPEFQRNFVWRSDQVRDLAESLYRDYPVGQMLLWDSTGYDIPKTAKGAETSQWIVDGQQRTVAFCLLLGPKPYWWETAEDWDAKLDRFDVMVNMQSEGDRLEFALANPVRRKDPAWVSVRDILRQTEVEELTQLATDIVARLGLEGDVQAFTRAHARLSHIWSIRGREIPAVSTRHDLEDVAEIFARLNQQGTRVSEADVVIALVAASNAEWAREEFLPVTRELVERGYDLDAGVYIRTLTGIARGTAALREIRRDFWRTEATKYWPQVRRAVGQVVHLLHDRGILSADLLPSKNSLIPLFALQSKFDHDMDFDRAFRWFLRANWDGRYSGSAITVLTHDLSQIRDSTSFEETIERLREPLEVADAVKPDDFLEDYWREKFLRLLIYLLLFENHATDWVSRARIGFDKTEDVLNDGFLPEWHHIFPRSYLRKHNQDESAINALANVTVLNEDTNRKRLNRYPPEQYIEKWQISEEDLAKHFVPTNVKPLEASKYMDFLVERANLLAAAANDYLRRLRE